ncbi:hypothetical protein H6P81_000913 [Aristolochia fimbriata]|uniref:Uncharacterized protein n=1 Tax=Aristolochia fimbriata TaxID=158543 RepID=A0AAV7F5E3_ARIFI|nr:hypothetical protein H6P81_000913 [Aristolochia fimbriata]
MNRKHDEQEENEAARPAEERPIYCTYARRRAARLIRASRSNVRRRPTKVRSSSLPARRKQAQETQMHALPEEEDEERREYDRWLDDYILRTMSDYGGELGMGQDKIVEFHNRKKASQQGKPTKCKCSMRILSWNVEALGPRLKEQQSERNVKKEQSYNCFFSKKQNYEPFHKVWLEMYGTSGVHHGLKSGHKVKFGGMLSSRDSSEVEVIETEEGQYSRQSISGL